MIMREERREEKKKGEEREKERRERIPNKVVREAKFNGTSSLQFLYFLRCQNNIL